MKTIKNISLFCGIVFSIFFVSFMVLAWSAPGSAPTGGNVAIPINESSTSQVKSGALGASLLQAENNILVGTTDATKATIYSKTPRSSSSFQNAKTNPLRIDGHCYGCESYYVLDGSSWRLRVSRSTTYPALFIEKTTNNVGIGHVFNGSNLPPLSAKLHIAQANMAVSPFHVQHKEYVGPGFSSDQAWRWATSLFIAPYTANVGIGTADPKAKLHVAGDMIVDGNVGIGTARPSAKLHVNGTGIFTGAVIVGDPTLDSHATTKEYVDSHSGGLPTGGSDGAVLRWTSNGPVWDTLLTWQGSTHTTYDCVYLGGTVFDTGTTGTICRLSSATVPSGWTQADNWARYYPTTWGGDDCGGHKSYTTTADFANVTTIRKRPGTSEYYIKIYCGSRPGSWIDCPAEGCYYSGNMNRPYTVITEENVKHDETNRVEVGIY